MFGIRCERRSVTITVTRNPTRSTFCARRRPSIPLPPLSRLIANVRLKVSSGAPVQGAARLVSRKCQRVLGEVVADVAEDVLDLVAKEDHRDDDGNGDDSDDECVLDQSLTVVFADEVPEIHTWTPLSTEACQ